MLPKQCARGLFGLNPHSYYTFTSSIRGAADWGEQAVDRGELPGKIESAIEQLGRRPRAEPFLDEGWRNFLPIWLDSPRPSGVVYR